MHDEFKPVAAVILAAGASRRLGTPKQLVRLGNETLLERTVRIAHEAGLSPVVGVVPANLQAIGTDISGMRRVVNNESTEGMASSIRAGIRALLDEEIKVSGAVVIACDQPAVTPGHLHSLAQGGGDVLASAYSGRRGIPAFFPLAAFEALLALHGDVGARHLLRDANALPLANGELDIDTLQDLERALLLYLTKSL